MQFFGRRGRIWSKLKSTRYEVKLAIYACNRWVVHGARERIALLESEKVLVQIFCSLL